ncbi:Uncharacterized protein TCM_030432 [Theobroma cacao]|uniref:Uncharacterized protein n=1 Tax=Theobroma cacao TaxID=3641 RepID=A0A061GHT1_THECC|nr:Uncharacterized protein TCM_030432 [Theobroma cacao]
MVQKMHKINCQLYMSQGKNISYIYIYICMYLCMYLVLVSLVGGTCNAEWRNKDLLEGRVNSSGELSNIKSKV